jgi:hypothetical protein
MELQGSDLYRRWTTARTGVQAQINQQSTNLQAAITPIENDLRAVAGMMANISFSRNRLSAIQTAIDTLENRASAAEASIVGMFDALQGEVQKFAHHLDVLQEMLKDLAEASFQLLPTEGGVMAVKAVWAREGKEKKDDPQGILYLTDQRLIIEQKEQVATKKVLFVATEKKLVQQLLFKAPLASITDIKTHKSGTFKNEDNLDLKLKDAFASEAHVHIWQDCNEWMALINRVKAGDFDKDRAVAIDKEA